MSFVERGRDLRLDFLRGLCVIGMIVDHVAGASWLYTLTGGNRFYASAAEGFVFVSGLVAGRAYTRFIIRDGLGYGLGRLLNRAGQLYVLAVALTLLFVPVSELRHLPWAFGWSLYDGLAFVVGVLTLHTTYYMVDVLSLYVLMLLAATGVFVLLMRGQTLLVLLGSWLLWALYQLFPAQVTMPWPMAGNNLFNFAAWQVLFFTGLVIGHRWEQRPIALPWRLFRTCAALSLLAILLYVLQDRLLQLLFRDAPDPDTARTLLVTSMFGKSDMRIGRVVVFGVIFVTAFLGVTRWWSKIRRWSGWLVLPLGQNALFAYSLHVVLALAIATAVDINTTSARTNAALQIGSMLAIWAVIRLAPVATIVQDARVRVGVPAVLAMASVVVLPRIAPDTGQRVPAVASGDSAAALVARAYGTAIPAEVVPDVSDEALAAPIAQPAVVDAQAGSSASGQLQGTLLEPEFYTAALNTTERYFIYLPPNYRTAGQRFPVLYMLHGGGGRAEWINYDLVRVADRSITAGQLRPMVIVMPQGDQGYWVNHVDGPRWGDYLAQDVVHHIDSTYPTLPDAAHRAVGGLSMGGWGALYQAFSHPDEFGVVGAHAASLRGGDGSMPFLPKGAAFNQFDPLQLARTAPGLANLRVWLDADDQDPWLKRDADLHARLDERHVPNEWHTFPGRHGGTYWQEHVGEYLDFYARSMANP